MIHVEYWTIKGMILHLLVLGANIFPIIKKVLSRVWASGALYDEFAFGCASSARWVVALTSMFEGFEVPPKAENVIEL